MIRIAPRRRRSRPWRRQTTHRLILRCARAAIRSPHDKPFSFKKSLAVPLRHVHVHIHVWIVKVGVDGGVGGSAWSRPGWDEEHVVVVVVFRVVEFRDFVRRAIVESVVVLEAIGCEVGSVGVYLNTVDRR